MSTTETKTARRVRVLTAKLDELSSARDLVDKTIGRGPDSVSDSVFWCVQRTWEEFDQKLAEALCADKRALIQARAPNLTLAEAYDRTDNKGPWLRFCQECVLADEDIAALVVSWRPVEESDGTCFCCNQPYGETA